MLYSTVVCSCASSKFVQLLEFSSKLPSLLICHAITLLHPYLSFASWSFNVIVSTTSLFVYPCAGFFVYVISGNNLSILSIFNVFDISSINPFWSFADT